MPESLCLLWNLVHFCIVLMPSPVQFLQDILCFSDFCCCCCLGSSGLLQFRLASCCTLLRAEDCLPGVRILASKVLFIPLCKLHSDLPVVLCGVLLLKCSGHCCASAGSFPQHVGNALYSSDFWWEEIASGQNLLKRIS